MNNNNEEKELFLDAESSLAVILKYLTGEIKLEEEKEEE